MRWGRNQRLPVSTKRKIAELYNTAPELLEFATPRAQDVWDRATGRLSEASGATIATEDIGWRRLTDSADGRDLTGGARDELYRYVQWLYHQNAFWHGLTDLPSYYVLGDGLSVEIPDENESEVWEAFWGDPDNDWDSRQHALFREWTLYGELLLPVFTAPTGRTRLGYIHPIRIKQLKTLPGNDLIRDAVVVKPPTPGERDLEFRIVRPSEAMLNIKRQDRTVKYYPYAPELNAAFYFARNPFMTGRGRPSLEHLADWLPAYDDMLFDTLRRLRFQGADLYDVTCEGLNQDELRKRQAEIEGDPPRPGSVRVHNESEKWEAVAPKLNSRETAEVSLEIKRLIGVSTGTPDHLVGAAEDVNRATAAESNLVFFRTMLYEQKAWRNIWQTMFRYVIDMAVMAEQLPLDTPRDIRITFPDLTSEDNLKNAQSLKATVEAIQLAMGGEAPLLDLDQGVRILFQSMSEEVPEHYVELLEQEAEKRKAELEERSAARLRDFMATSKSGGNGDGKNQQGGAGGGGGQVPVSAITGD